MLGHVSQSSDPGIMENFNFTAGLSDSECALDPGQLRSHLGDGGSIVRLGEDPRTGHEGVGSCARNRCDVVDLDAAIDLEPGLQASVVNALPHRSQLVESVGDKLL